MRHFLNSHFDINNFKVRLVIYEFHFLLKRHWTKIILSLVQPFLNFVMSVICVFITSIQNRYIKSFRIKTKVVTINSQDLNEKYLLDSTDRNLQKWNYHLFKQPLRNRTITNLQGHIFTHYLQQYLFLANKSDHNCVIIDIVPQIIHSLKNISHPLMKNH